MNQTHHIFDGKTTRSPTPRHQQRFSALLGETQRGVAKAACTRTKQNPLSLEGGRLGFSKTRGALVVRGGTSVTLRLNQLNQLNQNPPSRAGVMAIKPATLWRCNEKMLWIFRLFSSMIRNHASLSPPEDELLFSLIRVIHSIIFPSKWQRLEY